MRSKNRGIRRCFRCKEKGHEIASCPHIDNQDLVSLKMTINKSENKKQMPYEIEQHIWYNCHEKDHIIKVCQKSKIPTPRMSVR